MPLPKPCLRCGTPTRAGSYCPGCQPDRPSRQERGYGADHDRRSRQLRAHAQRNNIACVLCGWQINWAAKAPNPEAFSAHHTTRDKTGPLAVAHLGCNIRAGQPDQ